MTKHGTAKLSKKFNRCVKSVGKTVKARKGSNKESAAIAICTKSVLQTRGKTLKRYRKGKLTTQRKLRGGDIAIDAKNIIDKLVAAHDPIKYSDEQLPKPTVVEIPEAKGSPAIDDIIGKLKTVQQSKSTATKFFQAALRTVTMSQSQTAELETLLNDLKNTGKTGIYPDTPIDKLKSLYPMV